LQVEVLEDRSVPAVTVLGTSTATTDVFITGDNQSNDISVTMTGSSIKVQANGSTTLALDPSTTPGLIGSSSPTSIILNLPASGLDNLTIKMLNGDDKVSIGNCTIIKDLVIVDKPGGNDIVTINNTIVGNNTYIYLTSGDDKVFLTSSTFTNDVIISTAGGNDVVRFIPGPSPAVTTSVGGNLGIYTGGGNDRVFVDPGTSSAETLNVSGTTFIRTYGGNDFVSFGVLSSTTTGLKTVNLLQATVIDTGADNDRIYMRDANIWHVFVALLGDGDDTVMNNWGTDNVTVGFGSLLDGGSGTDSLLPPVWTAPANLTVINFP
jgi:hypothetical protein